ncbi:hypothetical protein ACOMHN_000439 [Nucella lapillus]
MSLMNQKPSEAGWFYHAPAKKVENPEPVGAPPASQIPGLGDIAVLPPEQPREMVFKDTDSKYICLAKMGGRKDLLVIRPNSGTKKEPKGYPRSDWYYLEDNAQQERARQSTEHEQWKFLLPDYMVHQSMGTTLPEDQTTTPRGGAVPMRPAPFATQQHNVHVVDGGKSTRKKRCEGRMAKTSPRSTEGYNESSRLTNRQRPSEQEEPTYMSKLLAYTYEREWREKHQAEEEKLAKNKKKSLPNKSYEPSKADAKPPTDLSARERGRNANANNNQALTDRKTEEDKKEPFKLSKFKKVPSRLDTRRSTEILTAKRK